MTQTERILERLKAGPMCSLEPLDWHPRITRTAARVQDLKDAGVKVTSETCKMHFDKTVGHSRYELATADQGRLFQ